MPTRVNAPKVIVTTQLAKGLIPAGAVLKNGLLTLTMRILRNNCRRRHRHHHPHHRSRHPLSYLKTRRPSCIASNLHFLYFYLNPRRLSVQRTTVVHRPINLCITNLLRPALVIFVSLRLVCHPLPPRHRPRLFDVGVRVTRTSLLWSKNGRALAQQTKRSHSSRHNAVFFLVFFRSRPLLAPFFSSLVSDCIRCIID